MFYAEEKQRLRHAMREAGLTAVASTQVRAPRIAEAPVALECRLMDELRYPAGRSIVVRSSAHCRAPSWSPSDQRAA